MAQFNLRVIVNPSSGTVSVREKKSMVETLRAAAEDQGFVPEICYTERPGHATELAAEAVRAGLGRVIAIGGDGTVNETARSLLHTRTALGIVPVGSGNGLARHLGLPLPPRRAIERALGGRPVVIDSGRVNEHPFFCTTGVGFDAYVAHLFARQPVRGLTTYARLALQAFLSYKPQTYRVDGESQTLFALTVANAGQFGNNAWIAPKANIADGLLDVCRMRPFPKRDTGMVTWQLFNRTLDQSAYMQTAQTRSAIIQGEGALSIHVDGEPVELQSDTMTVSVVPGSLLVVM